MQLFRTTRYAIGRSPRSPLPSRWSALLNYNHRALNYNQPVAVEMVDRLLEELR